MTVLLVLSVVILCLSLFKWKHVDDETILPHDPTQIPKPVCTSKKCRQILDLMDTSIDPCQDFYSYACGNWKKVHPKPSPSTQHWTNFVLLDRKNLELIRKVLEGKKGGTKYKTKWMNKVRKYYQQCKDRDDEKLKTTRKYIKHLMKHFPVKLKENKHNHKNLAKILANIFNNLGIDVFFHLSIGINDKNSSEHIIKIDQPKFTFPNRENYVQINGTTQQKNKKHFKKYVRTFLGLLHQSIKSASESKLDSLIELEYDLSLAELSPR